MRLSLKFCFLIGIAFMAPAVAAVEPLRMRHSSIVGPLDVSPEEAFEDKKVASLVNAIGREDVAEIDRQLKKGADINTYDVYKNTPLHWALTKKGIATETIEHLLKKGADPTLPGPHRISPLWLLANSNRPDLLEVMLRNGANPNINNGASTLLGEATLYQREDNISVLLKHGADVNATDQFGQGIICLKAAAVGRFDLVARYLEKGLNVDLIGCARYLEDRVVSNESGQNKWREKAFSLMKGKGVTFPLPPRPPVPLPNKD